MSYRSIAIAVLASIISLISGCSEVNPVLNYPNSPISTSVGNDQMKHVTRTIMLAGTRIGWQMKHVGEGHIVATIFRTGAMAKVDIHFTTQQFSIKYNDSSNMGYDGTQISNTYNSLVSRLHRSITSSLKNQ